VIGKKSFIFLTGHKGLVGSAILRRLRFYGYKNIIIKTKKQLNLKDQSKVFKSKKLILMVASLEKEMT